MTPLRTVIQMALMGVTALAAVFLVIGLIRWGCWGC